MAVDNEKLLGQGTVIINEKNPSRVIVRSVELFIDGKTAQSFDLSKPEKLLNLDFIVYRLNFAFHVQREIASGLQYMHIVKQFVVSVEYKKVMGNYEPKLQLQGCKLPLEWCFVESTMLTQGSWTMTETS